MIPGFTKHRGAGGRSIVPSIANLGGGIFSSIAANTPTSATVSVTAGTMLIVAFAQETTTTSSNPAIISVTASGLTFTRLGSFIGPGNSATANEQSIEVWGAAVPSTVSSVAVTWKYNTAIDDATYSFAQVTNYGSVAFSSVYTQVVSNSQSITYSIPEYALAFGVVACAANSSTPGALTGFTLLDTESNSGGSYWEFSSTSYRTAAATAVTNATASQADTLDALIFIGIILGK